MATNNAVSFNQLKKSVFNMKNYNDQSIQEIYNNINRPYTQVPDLIKTVATVNSDTKKLNIDNYDYSKDNSSGYGNQIYKNYTDKTLYDYFNDQNNYIDVKVKYNGEYVINEIYKISGSGIILLKSYKPDSNNTKYYFKIQVRKNFKIDSNTGTLVSSQGDFYFAANYSYDENVENPMTGDFEISISILKPNEKGISSFKTIKEVKGNACSLVPYEYNTDNHYVGNRTINFGSGDAPRNSYITDTNDFGANTYPSTSGYLGVFGYSNYIKMINFALIAGGFNNIDSYYTGSGMSGVLCVGGNNKFKEKSGTPSKDSYLGIVGNNIKVSQAGFYIGAYGTVPYSEIFAICNGTQTEDKTLLSINRDTGAVTSISTPTENNHLTNKKYVDDKVAGIVNSAPETLDTLQELATALGNDPNFATTVSTQIGKKVDKVDGMSLTHNDLTNELKANYDAAYTYSQAKHSYNDLTDKPTIPSIDGLATTEYVDSKSLPILFLDDSNRTGDKLFPLLPEHNLVFIAGDAQFTDENGNINIIYGLCYSDLQADGSKLLTEYRTSKSASIATNGTLKSFDYIDEYTKTILALFKNAPSGKVLVKNQNNTFEWIELPSTPDLSSYAPITSPVFKKSIRIGDIQPDKTLGENSIIASSYGEASGKYTLSNGKAAAARADYSHAEGYACISKAIYSHAEGEQCITNGQSSHAEGHGSTANGIDSHAEGYYTTTNGKYSHVEGYKTIATGDNQHVQGKYNIEDKDNKYAHIVGNGYRDELKYKDYRSNAYTLDWSGNGWFAGKVTQEGTPTDDKDLVNKKYVDDANVEATDEEVNAMLLEVLGGDYSAQS
nr:MAG TPA: Baseplate wedge protein [Caudoviricetes sp.]